jgi:pyruvate,water dikinase|tara:strand:+ start:12734 stop:16261 length:3528 start_codon:yes stop_codon:yes gene_type:complete
MEEKKRDEFIKWFSELNKDSINIAGGKGANLAEIYNEGIPVPPGFVITAQAYDYFIEYAKLKEKIKELLDRIDYEDTKKLDEMTKQIRVFINDSEFPKDLEEDILEAYEHLGASKFDSIEGSALDILKTSSEPIFVAIRSSATTEDLKDASFAGQQDSFVNIKGKKELLKHIRKSFASLFTSRATYYRNKKGFKHETSSLAVVIQKMVDSEKSGVIFSKDPSYKKDDILIEAIWGLGEGIVSGKITPDKYIVSSELKILDKNISNKKIAITRNSSGEKEIVKLKEELSKSQVLKEHEIMRLAEITIKIENHYKNPQDIEFAIEGENIYIVQTRPITTLEKRIETKDIKELQGEIILKGIAASPGIAYGKIRIIEELEDLDRIKQGDILVTKMTNPDMVVTMQKSAGIVTDDGGLTCFAGDTKVLTNKGFLTMEEINRRYNEKEDFLIFSYDYKNKKPTWKKIINAGTRKRNAIRISVSQKGNISHNTVDLTPDHKMFTFENRNLIKKEIQNIIKDNEMLCLVDKLPKFENQHNIKLSYLMGALLSDGHFRITNHHTGNPRRGVVVFTQKSIEEKKLFIETVKSNFKEIFNEEFNLIRDKYCVGNIDGRAIYGWATDHICSKLAPAMALTKITQNLPLWTLGLSQSCSLNFLAGLIDGDGCFHNNRMHIYVAKENLLQAIIIACLKLGIMPQISVNRNIHHVQILEKMNEILSYCKRVKGKVRYKQMGNKLFAAKQILGDIVDKINYKGRIKPYIHNNLLIDSRKIFRDIFPLTKGKTKQEILNILNSNIRMQRFSQIENLGKIYVYNIEVEAENELDKNYIVFTKKYTPLLVSNSHASIVSREMGVPAVVGTNDATTLLKDGETITVDGFRGIIYKGKVSETIQKEILPVKTDTKTKIKLILDLPSYAIRAAKTGLTGIGLTRIEGIIAESKKHPNYFLKQDKINEYEEIIFKGIKEISKHFEELWIRTSDIRSDEFQNLEGASKEKEANPMLGNHGIRYGIKNPEILKAELKALKRISEENKKIGLLLPQVISVEDVKKVKEFLKEVNFDNVKIGIMIETPASVQLIKDLCDEGIDFISFGTNDLTQYILAVDRGNKEVQYLYDEMNPAVLYQLEYVLRVCKRNKVETSICGQAGSKKEMVKFLVERGIDSISVNADVASEIADYVNELEKKVD